jgi:hypothetical protein
MTRSQIMYAAQLARRENEKGTGKEWRGGREERGRREGGVDTGRMPNVKLKLPK